MTAPFPTFTAGNQPTAGQMQALLPMYKTKAADEPRTSNTTPSNDADLVLTGLANATYEVAFSARVTGAGSATVGDIVLQWTYPTGSGVSFEIGYTGLVSAVAYGVNTTGSVNTVSYLTTTSPSTSAPFGTPSTNFAKIIGTGLWVVGATGGSLQLQWAQRVSTATSTKLGAGSWLSLRRVA